MPQHRHVSDISSSFPGDGASQAVAGSSSSVPVQKRGRGPSEAKSSGKDVKGAGSSTKLKESKDEVPRSKKLKQTTLK